MNIPIIINVVISLIFIYLIFSLLLSAIQEYITSILEWRAKSLKSNIAQILDGISDFDQSTIAKQLYAKPLINYFNIKGDNWLKKILPRLRHSQGPSYINSQFFSASLLEVLREDYNFNWEEYANKLSEVTDLLEVSLQIANSRKNEQKTENQQLQELQYKLEATKLDKSRAEDLSCLPPELLKILATLARQTKYRVEKTELTIKEFQKEIAYWFDSSMERASGAYKRNAAGLALLIGFLMVAIGNVDTIYMVNRLYNEPAFSSAISKLAETNCSTSEIAECQKNIQKIQEENLNSLPVGWHYSPEFPWLQLQQKQQNWGSVLVGWIISAIALAQGSPFWFELLNKVLNVRNAGQKPPTLLEAEKEKAAPKA
jgi:hypothetical protein